MIRQIDTSNWTQGTNFSDLFDTLVKIVQGGPPAITDFIEDITAPVDPNDPDAVPPASTAQSSLDLLLAASVDPAVAQMLGLYWVDDSAIEGQSYDYLLVADHNNAGNGSVQTILGLVTAENYDNITAYQRIGVVHAVSPPLTPPQHSRAYVLPPGAIPPGVPADAAGLVGLRWDVATRTDSTKIAQDTSFLFNLWRHDYGRTQPPDVASADAHTRVGDFPIAPGDPRVADPEAIITGWPTFGLFAVDGPLVEGWYSYCLSGIDILRPAQRALRSSGSAGQRVPGHSGPRQLRPRRPPDRHHATARAHRRAGLGAGSGRSAVAPGLGLHAVARPCPRNRRMSSGCVCGGCGRAS